MMYTDLSVMCQNLPDVLYQIQWMELNAPIGVAFQRILSDIDLSLDLPVAVMLF